MTQLVLVPGLLCTADLFRAQIATLNDQVDIMVAPTTGASSIGGLADALLAQAAPRFAIAGLSMGGYIAFEVLRRAPERVERLALLDTNARADLPEQTSRRRELIAIARSVSVRKVQGMLLPYLLGEASLGDEDLVARVLAMADAFAPDAFEAQQEAIIARPDNRPFLSEIRCPTTIIVGEDDRLTPIKVAKEMAEGIAGSRYCEVGRSGHLSTMEQPDEVTAMLSDWLAG